MGENKGGRPRKQIDKETFEKLCDLQCTVEDLADFFSCSHDTIQRWCMAEYGESFASIHKKHMAKGKASLRRNMFRLSEKNATMAIFLAKNYLGMSDNVEVKADTSLMSALLDVVKGGKNEIQS